MLMSVERIHCSVFNESICFCITKDKTKLLPHDELLFEFLLRMYLFLYSKNRIPRLLLFSNFQRNCNLPNTLAINVFNNEHQLSFHVANTEHNKALLKKMERIKVRMYVHTFSLK